MNTVNNTVSNIDWKLLQSQKLYLLDLTDTGHDTPEMWGVIHLIDAIQDAVVADGVANESVVFNITE
jgi:hypothetical protein